MLLSYTIPKLKPYEYTPVNRHGHFWIKRDDLFETCGVHGGKARTCWHLAQGAVGLVTASSRSSPQANILAHIAQSLGVPCRVHTPEGVLSPELLMAQGARAEVVQHRAGYNSVIIARAREDAEVRGWRYIPFGMECEEAILQTAAQVANIPEGVKRIVVPIGSGMSVCGIMAGLQAIGRHISILGVRVGADPTRRLDTFFPAWRKYLFIVQSEFKYKDEVLQYADYIRLDPIYEAKCWKFIQDFDCFWLVGVRKSL